MRRFFPILLLLLISGGCANIKAPSGGPRDSEGPLLLSASPENQAVNFEGNSFRLTFNEWIQLRDIRNQLVVSPPLKTAPEVQLKKRTVTVSWDEELKENTTYSFFFGDGIQDFTEGNSAEQLMYVFSTGPELDSLQISGRLVHAEMGDPLGSIKVLAYALSGDSLALKEKPDYFTKADNDGKFQISYMRPGSYEVVAIGDENRNYLLDENELVGFHNERITATPTDTLESALKIRCSPQPAFTQYLKAYEPDSSGHVAILPSKVSPDLNFTDTENPEREILQAWNPAMDSLHIWLTGSPANSRVSVQVRDGQEILDTIAVPFFDREDRSLNLQFLEKGKRDAREWLGVKASGRIKSFDPERILVRYDTTARKAETQVSLLDPRKLRIRPGLEDGFTYELVLLPEAVTSAEGWTNRDTLASTCANFASEDFADLRIKLTGFHSPEVLLFQILDEKSQVARTLKAEDGELLLANRLTPAAYNVRWLDDRNGNGRWDGCDYIGRVPSEEVGYFPEAIQARSNWVLDVEWIVKE